MNIIQIDLDSNVVVVFDAPENATHGKFTVDQIPRYDVCRKNKVLESVPLDIDFSAVVNIGSLANADESLVANLFTPVKHGNFYDYEYNGVFYPNAKSAFEDMVVERCNYTNPYALILEK